MLGIKTESGDIQISNGKFLIEDINEQIVENIITANPGDYKEKPMLGMSIYTLLNGIVDEFFPGRLKSQLITQHVTVKSLFISDSEINIEV